MKKRALACLLAAVLILQSAGPAALALQAPAQEEEDGAGCTFNFTAARYVLSEADGAYGIEVERTGSYVVAADVVFKVVDVFAAYGEDYTVLDGAGTALEQTEGTVLPPQALAKLAPAQEQLSARAEASPSGGSDVFEARNLLLGIDSQSRSEQEQVRDEITAVVETVNRELFDAQGVSGVLHFAPGEAKKSFTVVPVDNSQSEADKTVLLALLGTSSGQIAPNSTASLTIMDDEAYVPPVFELAEHTVTLDAASPAAELTVRRISGLGHYSTVYVSTYSMTAKTGEDFAAIENEQLVFAPGEQSKSLWTQALSFDRSGDFGVRLKSDGSCRIGENDRTLVHIAGALSQPEAAAQPQADAAESGIAPSAAAADPSPAADAPEEGTAGQPSYSITRQSDDSIITAIDSSSLRRTYPVGEKIYIGAGWYNRYLRIDWGTDQRDRSYLHSSAIGVESVTLKFTVSSVSGLSWHRIYINSGYAHEKTVPLKAGQYEVTIPKANNFRDSSFVTFRTEKGASCAVTFDAILLNSRPLPITIAPIDPVETQPIIDLDTGIQAVQIVNYQPPAPTFKTDTGAEVKAVYPNPYQGAVTVSVDEDLARHGIFLMDKGVDYREVYNGKRYKLYDLYSQLSFPGELVYLPSTREVTVHLECTDGGDTFISAKGDKYQSPFQAQMGTILRGHGYAAAGKVITGYELYAAKLDGKGELGERRYLYTYQNPKDASLLGGYAPEEWFHVPAIAEEGWTEVLIVPKTEIQDLVVRPHPSTKNETVYEDIYDDAGNVIGQREITYGGRVYLNRAFDSNAGEEDTYVADQDGQIRFERINSGSVFTLRSVSPMGYLTEWVNGTMDKDGDGVIDNAQAGDLTQARADELYIPVYGNQFVYQANQSSPQYYYRFTKFDPARLLNGRTRVGYVKKDKRTILEYDGKAAQYKDYVPCAGATVQIGENTAVTDSTGRYAIPMDGVPDAVRVSAVITTDSGSFITHIQSNVENNTFIPFYDTFEPQGVTAAYKDETAITAPAIKIADQELTVTVKVLHSVNSMYVKSAGFYITDSSGKKVVDCVARAEEADSNYKISYTDDGTFGYAQLKMNPGEDMLTGYKLYVYFVDQNGTEHRALDTGHRFLELLDLGTFALGAVGSSLVADATTEVVDLLGAPLFDFNMGQIEGFTVTTGLLEPTTQLLDESGNKMYQYDAALYSFRYKTGEITNWSGKKGSDEGSGNTGGDTGGDTGTDPDPADYQAQHGEILDKMKQVSSFDPDQVESESPPKGADMNNGKKGVTSASEYNFGLTPSIRFDLITTTRPVGKDKDGNDVYKHYFEEMSLGVGLDFDVNSRTEIAFPIGISVLIKPSLTGSVEAVYYMKTDYGDDKYWTQRPIEYTPESFGLFRDYGGNMYRAGYISLNPKITLAVGVKVAIVEVDVAASFDFDMDFKFDSSGTRTYGSMEYNVRIVLTILKLTVYSKKLTDGKVHLFGEDGPIDNDVTLMSTRMTGALTDALESGDLTVRPMDRSYLAQRSAWLGEMEAVKPLSADLSRSGAPMDEDHPLDALLQTGVMTGDGMASAMLGPDTMFAVYVDDDPRRGANDRSCVYYTYTNADGSWTEPAAIEDDGTLDKDPVVYDMGGKLFVAWLTANEAFDGREDSLDTLSAQLNSLNIHAAFFDKETRTFGEIFEVTKNTEDDFACEGGIAVTGTGGDGVRVYYTKTTYLEHPLNVNEMIAVASVIAYRDYRDGAWSETYTDEERQAIQDGGVDPDLYTEQWYGQRFTDVRINGRWPFVTDQEADMLPDGSTHYFAFIADTDGSYETAGDRKVYLLFDALDAPVCVTPEEGAYEDLRLVYSGSQLLMTFKTGQSVSSAPEEDGAHPGGIAYVNLSDVFEKADYEAVRQPDGTYQMAWRDTVTDEGERSYYAPGAAVSLDGVVQNYEVFSDLGGRIYLMWTDSTRGDDGQTTLQIYASVYNGDPAWTEDTGTVQGYSDAVWSTPVLLTSPLYGSYNTFTAQSVTGDGIALVAKRTAPSGETELVFHLRVPQPVFSFNESLLSASYARIGVPVTVHAAITNVGLKAHKTSDGAVNGKNTWVAQPGQYLIRLQRLVDGTCVETLAETQVDAVWNIGGTLYASCEWTPQELPDNMDLRVSVTDRDTGGEICSELVPVVKASEIELGQVSAVSGAKNEAEVSFDLANKGNIPAQLTAVLSVFTGETEKAELARMELGTLDAAQVQTCKRSVPIEEKYQSIDEETGSGSFRLQIDLFNGDENVYCTTASGAVLYSPEAIADVKEIASLTVDRERIQLEVGEKKQVNAALSPASAAQHGKVLFESSDESVAAVDQNGQITAVGAGEATITAYAVSRMEFSAVQPDGSTRLLDVRDFIPDSFIKTREIALTVSAAVPYPSAPDKDPGPSVTSSGEGSVTVDRDGGVTMTPAEGSYITGVIVNGTRVSIPRDGRLTGLKPTDKVEVIFEPLRQAELTAYLDLAPNAWYTEAIGYAVSHGLFNGTSATAFSPDDPMTRGMLATVLHRADGTPDAPLPGFDDVAQGEYYTQAVGWAAERGIVNGYGGGLFGPDDPITREQLAVMLWRYAGRPAPSNLILEFTDADKAGAYALDALRWAVEQGLISGKGGGILDPTG